MLPPSIFSTLSPEGQAVAAQFACESEDAVCEWVPQYGSEASGGLEEDRRKTQDEQLPKLRGFPVSAATRLLA
jgi:hypothetical protein